MGYISSFFNNPNFSYGLQTLSTENSLAPIYEYFVMPLELMDFWMAASGKFSTKKVDEGWIATLSPKKSEIFSGADINYPPISFKTFVGRDEELIKDEAIKYFRSKKLDICSVNNWLVNNV